MSVEECKLEPKIKTVLVYNFNTSNYVFKLCCQQASKLYVSCPDAGTPAIRIPLCFTDEHGQFFNVEGGTLRYTNVQLGASNVTVQGQVVDGYLIFPISLMTSPERTYTCYNLCIHDLRIVLSQVECLRCPKDKIVSEFGDIQLYEILPN